MRKYLLSYMDYVEDFLNGKTKAKDIELVKAEHLRQIQFMQHERFIHLVVTCLFATMLFICLAALFISGSSSLPLILLIILLLLPLPPYVWHYYFMENSTQKMYAQYNRLCEMQKEDNPMSKLPDACKIIKG